MEQWKARFFALQNTSGGSGLEELVGMYEARLRILQDENAKLVNLIKQLINDNEHKDLAIA